MNLKKYIYLFLILPLFAFVSSHKFYVSVTNINHNISEKALQITTRIFIDDFQRMLLERYDYKKELGAENDTERTEELIKKYLSKKIKVWVNGKEVTCNYLGKQYEDDIMVCYIEISNISEVKTLSVENKILFEIEDDQQNLVHIKIKDQRKSLLLVKENDKGLLKF